MFEKEIILNWPILIFGSFLGFFWKILCLKEGLSMKTKFYLVFETNSLFALLFEVAAL